MFVIEASSYHATCHMLSGLSVTNDDYVYIIQTLTLEKACGLRKALSAHRTGVQRYDLSTLEFY